MSKRCYRNRNGTQKKTQNSRRSTIHKISKQENNSENRMFLVKKLFAQTRRTEGLYSTGQSVHRNKPWQNKTDAGQHLVKDNKTISILYILHTSTVLENK